MSSKPKLNSCGSFDPVIFNACYPIVGVTVYDNGVMTVRRESKLQGQLSNSKNGRTDRQIMKFTSKSMSRLIATINATEVDFKTMVTLTYPALFPRDGDAVKKDLNRFTNIFRRKYKTDYIWFLEFQARGAPHFHFLTELEVISPRLRVDIAENWVQGIGRSEWLKDEAARVSLVRDCGCEYDVIADNICKSFKFTLRRDTVQVLRDKNGAKKYVTKYAAKEYQKKPPKNYSGVGRFWGCSEGVKLQGGQHLEKTEDEVRSFLKSQEHACGEWDVLPKFLFNIQNLG